MIYGKIIEIYHCILNIFNENIIKIHTLDGLPLRAEYRHQQGLDRSNLPVKWFFKQINVCNQ